MSDTEPKGRGGGVFRVIGCATVVVLLLGGCYVGMLGGVRILAEPPAFHNFVYRNDRMLFHNWRLDGFAGDGTGAAAAVDLHREYVLCVLSEDPQICGAVSYSIDGLHYSIQFSPGPTFRPGPTVAGTVQPRTIEVFDARTGRRTTTRLQAGEAFEWKAEVERAQYGDPPKADFRAMLKAHGVPLP